MCIFGVQVKHPNFVIASLNNIVAAFSLIILTGQQSKLTERGGSVVTHETRIREVPGSNPVADQPG